LISADSNARRLDPSHTSSTVALYRLLEHCWHRACPQRFVIQLHWDGTRTSTQSFNRLVGMGLLTQCLSGSNRMAAVMSLTVSSWNSANVQPNGTDENDGGGALAVKARTSATFASKCRWNSATSICSDSGTRPRPISASMDRHSCRGKERSESTLLVQNASRFKWSKAHQILIYFFNFFFNLAHNIT